MFRLVTAIIVSTLMMSDVTLAQARNSKASGYEQLNLFGEAFERIRQDAVEPVAEKKLVEAAIAGMLSGLDTRSAYISEAALKASQGSASDAAATSGLVVTIENGQLNGKRQVAAVPRPRGHAAAPPRRGLRRGRRRAALVRLPGLTRSCGLFR